MTELAELPAAFLENIDWVNQPPPKQARDTHALHFFLQGPPITEGTSPVYQGLLFYHQGLQPTSQITQRQNGLDGTGIVIRGKPLVVGTPGSEGVAVWARVMVRFRTQPTARISVVLDLHRDDTSFHHLPGTRMRQVEFGTVDPTNDGRVIRLDPGTSNHWELHRPTL